MNEKWFYGSPEYFLGKTEEGETVEISLSSLMNAKWDSSGKLIRTNSSLGSVDVIADSLEMRTASALRAENDRLTVEVARLKAALENVRGLDVEQMGELKPCPFCNGKLSYFGKDLNRRVSPPVVVDVYKHFYADENDTSKDCCLSQLIFDETRWNTRPIEDAISAEYDDLLNMYEKDTEKLRAENERLKNRYEIATSEAAGYKAENERLRASLEKSENDLYEITHLSEGHNATLQQVKFDIEEFAANIRAALAESEPK